MIEWRFLQTLTKDKRSRETPFSEKNGVAATLFCRIVQEEGGVVLNTSKGGEATFASSTGNLSRSYDIAVPGTMLNGMVQCRVLIREGKRLQLARRLGRHDQLACDGGAHRSGKGPGLQTCTEMVSRGSEHVRGRRIAQS